MMGSLKSGSDETKWELLAVKSIETLKFIKRTWFPAQEISRVKNWLCVLLNLYKSVDFMKNGNFKDSKPERWDGWHWVYNMIHVFRTQNCTQRTIQTALVFLMWSNTCPKYATYQPSNGHFELLGRLVEPTCHRDFQRVPNPIPDVYHHVLYYKYPQD